MAKNTDTVETTETPVSVEVKFSKSQILAAKKYRKRVDLANALLADGGEYTLSEVDAFLDNYLKGAVVDNGTRRWNLD